MFGLPRVPGGGNAVSTEPNRDWPTDTSGVPFRRLDRHDSVFLIQATITAEVRTAYPIDEERRERLAEVLGKATGKHVTVKVVIDPSVLGGVVARVGDTVIDGTIRHRLEQLRESL